MARTGTDLFHDIDFQAQAEAYRRDLVRALNHEHAYGGPEKRPPWRRRRNSSRRWMHLRTPHRASGQRLTPGGRAGSLLVWALLWLGAAWMGAGRLERDGRSLRPACRLSRACAHLQFVAMVAYVFIGLMAIAMGASHVATWQASVVTAEQAQQESIDEARGYFALGKSGPDDRSWVDLSESRWQNEYAGTRVIRRPGVLAGIAAGSVDPAPVAVQLGSRTDPLSVTGYRIENPEIVSRSVDLVFVLTMLTPLLVGVLGLGLGSREREAGIDRLVTVQAGAVRGWLVARGVAITVLVGAAVAGLCVAAALVGGAGWIEGVALLTLGLAYTGLWGGLLLVVAAHARTVRVAAFEFGAIWTVLCVLLPAAAAEVGVGRIGADFAIEQTLDARASSGAPMTRRPRSESRCSTRGSPSSPSFPLLPSHPSRRRFGATPTRERRSTDWSVGTQRGCSRSRPRPGSPCKPDGLRRPSH